MKLIKMCGQCGTYIQFKKTDIIKVKIIDSVVNTFDCPICGNGIILNVISK